MMEVTRFSKKNATVKEKTSDSDDGNRLMRNTGRRLRRRMRRLQERS